MKADAVMITQAVDEEDPVLGFTPGWVNGLARHLGRLSAYCLRAGKHELRHNVSVQLLGEGKLRRLWRLRKGLKADLNEMNVRAIFAHMCPRYAVAARRIVGREVPIILWYAQWAKSRWLTAAHKVSRIILTPVQESCPLQSDRVRVVGHGIDTEKFRLVSRKRSGNIVLLSAGRIAREKRYEFLIEAVAAAKEALPLEELALRIVGSPTVPSDEQYFSELKRVVREKGLDEAVEFRFAVPYTRIQDEYADCDLFISTTVRHSFDKAPLEAMACGKIMLTTNQSFRTVLGQYADLLIAEDQNPHDLAKRIVHIARMEPPECERLRLALREAVVRDHSLDRLMKEVGDIIASL